MVVLPIIRVAAVAIALLSTGASAETIAVSTAGAATSDKPFIRIPLARRRPGLRPSRPRSGKTTAPTYSVVSVGAPSADSEPAAFNNTGQIAGYGDTGCYVYDSGRFQRLPIPSAGTQYINCRLASMNDETAAGTYQIGGTTANPYSSNAAFSVTPRTTIIYYAYGSSALRGVNNNGMSLVSAAFVPVRTTDISGQQYFTGTDGAGYLAQVQAPASSAPVHYLLPFEDLVAPTCAFGGCLINDLNEILGYDFSTVTPTSVSLAVYTLGNSASLADLPISFNATEGFVQSYGPVAFNNRNQILYDASAGANLAGIPAIYDIGSGKKTVIPLVTPNCPKGGHGDPLSMNNNGEVLGDYYCNNSFFGYFTWDAVSGTHDLSLAIPNTNFTLYPIGVNDSGAILIELLGGGNLVSWGTLDPVASSSAKASSSIRSH